MTPDVGLGQFPWEANAPAGHTICFKLTAGSLKFEMGYVLYPAGVKLVCAEKIGDGKPTIWREHWASREEAVRSAENMVAEAVDYIEILGVTERPYEDLDCDDFLEHLRLNIAGLLH